jgi:hypothetical protein
MWSKTRIKAKLDYFISLYFIFSNFVQSSMLPQKIYIKTLLQANFDFLRYLNLLLYINPSIPYFQSARNTVRWRARDYCSTYKCSALQRARVSHDHY